MNDFHFPMFTYLEDGAARRRMVAAQIEARGVSDPRVLEAMRRVPRHRFVPGELRAQSCQDHPLPIGHGQTISQPYIVALMSELAAPGSEDAVLEIGTGCGYQTAVLAELARQVCSIEIVPALAAQAAALLAELGYQNAEVRAGDGYAGWPGRAPFNAIVVTAAAPSVPPALLGQLAPGGRLVIPEGERDGAQTLKLFTRAAHGYDVREVAGVRFVPMTGRAQGEA